jgi:hypothetical protein
LVWRARCATGGQRKEKDEENGLFHPNILPRSQHFVTGEGAARAKSAYAAGTWNSSHAVAGPTAMIPIS